MMLSPRALRDAALEAFGGAYLEEDLQEMIDPASIKQKSNGFIARKITQR